jgi:hypothetical protein
MSDFLLLSNARARLTCDVSEFLLLSGNIPLGEKILEERRAYGTLFFRQEKNFHDNALISGLEADSWPGRRG